MAVSKSSNTVTVACKLPHGLLLRVFEAREVREAGTNVTVKQYVELPFQQEVQGFSHEQNRAPHCQFTSGYALTFGIDKDLWDKWLEQNKNTDIVKNGLIFAHSDMASVEAEGREKEKVRSCFERIDRNEMPNTGRIKVKQAVGL